MRHGFGSTASGRVPWGLVGMFGLIVAAECVLAHHWRDWSGYLILNCQFAGSMARTEATCSEVLCLGDSQVKTGIDPIVLERGLGRRAFNLGVVGSPTPLSYFLLRRALDAGARPKAILLGHMTMGGGPRAAHHFEVFVEPREFLDLVWHTADPQYAATLLLTRLLPSFRHRESIRGQIIGKAHSQRARMSETERAWRDRRGAYLIPPSPEYHGQIEPDLAASLYGKPWYISALSARYFDRLVGLAEARSIPVFFLVSPIVPEAQSRRNVQGLDAHHTRNLRALQARHPNLTVIDARRPDWPVSEFLDSLHLNDRGAQHLSAEVAAVLRRQLNPVSERSRWIALGGAASGRHAPALAKEISVPVAR